MYKKRVYKKTDCSSRDVSKTVYNYAYEHEAKQAIATRNFDTTRECAINILHFVQRVLYLLTIVLKAINMSL